MADEKLGTEVRREQIAEAALNLVAGSGLRRLSIAAVARRVGLVPSGIYRHFRSKAEIIEAVLDLLETRLMDNVAAARQEGGGSLECLRGVFVRHIRFIREGRAIPQIIFSDDLHGGLPDRKERVMRIISRYAGAIAELVRSGQQAGEIRAAVDPDSVALMFFGMIVPAGILWHLTDGGFDVTRHASRAWPIFQAAIAVPGESDAARDDPVVTSHSLSR